MTTRRRFTGEFKARVALAALRGDKTVPEIAARHKVHPNQVSTWKRQAIDGRFETINHALVMADRERAGREASPTGAIIDSQSVKTTEAGGPRGYDAGRKIDGCKRLMI